MQFADDCSSFIYVAVTSNIDREDDGLIEIRIGILLSFGERTEINVEKHELVQIGE